MDHIASWDADGFACQTWIGQIARVTAQEVIGDAATDAVELDSRCCGPASAPGR
jgi:hypothetical protein